MAVKLRLYEAQDAEKIQGLAFPKLPLRPDLGFFPDFVVTTGSGFVRERRTR